MDKEEMMRLLADRAEHWRNEAEKMKYAFDVVGSDMWFNRYMGKSEACMELLFELGRRG